VLVASVTRHEDLCPGAVQRLDVRLRLAVEREGHVLVVPPFAGIHRVS